MRFLHIGFRERSFDHAFIVSSCSRQFERNPLSTSIFTGCNQVNSSVVMIEVEDGKVV